MFAALRLLPLFALSFLSFQVRATQMWPLSVEELAQQADLIVHGTVTNKKCVQNPDGRIVTRVQLEVTEVWKGALATNSLTVVHGGGQIGHIHSEVSGQVEYSVGEEVVAFLVLNPRGEAVTIGLAQGKFHVWKDKATGEKFVHNIFHGVTEQAAARVERKSERLALKELSRRAKGGAR